MSVKKHHKAIGFLSVWIIYSIIGILLLLLDVGQEIENRTWDWRAKFIARTTPPDPNIKIITIDQSALDHYAQNEYESWPWPRQYYAAVVEYLKLADAKGVAFDIIYSEPSSRGVEDDNSFVDTFEPQLPVISAIPLRIDEAEFDESRLKLLENRLKEKKIQVPENTIIEYKSLILPITQLLEKSAGFGNVTAQSDSDGIYRRIKLGGKFKNLVIPILPLSMLISTGGDIPVDLDESITNDGSLIVNYRGEEQTYETISIAQIIASRSLISEGKEPLIPLQHFKDSYVFIGMSAPGLLDLRPSPLSGKFPGVEINATILDNLIHNDFIRMLPTGYSVLLILFLVAIVSIPIFIFRKSVYQTVPVVVTFVLFIILLYISARYGYWVPCIAPLSGMSLAVLGSLGVQYGLEGRQHKFIKDAFKYYVSPEVIDKIIDDPTKLSLGGERRELTIFFSDLAGFTSISEKMNPHQLSIMLNEFLTAMTDIILDSGGTLDKYEGDAIIAFWNAPLDIPNHADKAVIASLACQEKLKDLEKYFQDTYDVHLHMRVGLNTGEVSVGNFGSRERFNYTIIGDAANLASRLEGVNKVFGTSILFSETTRQKLHPTIKYRKIGNIQVVGKAVSIPVFEPVSPRIDTTLHEEAMRSFEAGDLVKALDIFKQLPTESLYKKYISRIEDDIKKPLDSFTPVWKLESK